jgi:hypothetical protein
MNHFVDLVHTKPYTVYRNIIRRGVTVLGAAAAAAGGGKITPKRWLHIALVAP